MRALTFVFGSVFGVGCHAISTTWDHSTATAPPALQITKAPELRKRDSNTLLDGICSQPFYHVETINGYFLVPWVGCDEWRPQCCLPGYAEYAFTIGTEAPTANPADFRVTACPDGFVTATVDLQPVSVQGICCPSKYGPLPSYRGDWSDRGPLCARSMASHEGQGDSNGDWPVVMHAVQFWNESTVFHAPEARFTSRFVAVGYYVDQGATASTSDVTIATATTLDGTLTSAAEPRTSPATAKGSGASVGVVAGATVCGVFVGALAGAIASVLAMRKRRKKNTSVPRVEMAADPVSWK